MTGNVKLDAATLRALIAEADVDSSMFRWLQAKLDALPPEQAGTAQWKPIAIAPKDGTWVLCAWRNSVGRYGVPTPLYWHGDCWTAIDPCLTPVVQNALQPTHWMALPPSPNDDAKLEREEVKP